MDTGDPIELMATHSVLKDNPTVTNKCQIISRNSPYLYLTNVAAYGEVTYTVSVDEHDPITLQTNDVTVMDEDIIYEALESSLTNIGENTVATITERVAVFYFRVEADADNASPFITDITPMGVFSDLILAGRVVAVTKEDATEDVEFIEAGVVSDETITSTVNKYNWAQPAPEAEAVGSTQGPADVIVSEPQPNYHVYKVIMGTTDEGLPWDINSPVDFSFLFSDLSNNTYQKPVCGNCNAFNPYALLNGGDDSIAIGGVRHYSFYNLTATDFAVLLEGQTITMEVEDATTNTYGVNHIYYYDASLCEAACIDLCVATTDNIDWHCCDSNANNFTPGGSVILNGFWPDCDRCWDDFGIIQSSAPTPCTYDAPDPTPICCDSNYLEYYGNAGIDISIQTYDENGMPETWECLPHMCVTPLTGETEVIEYEDSQGNYSATVESLPGTTIDVEFFIFDKQGRILFDHNDVLGRNSKSVRYNKANLVEKTAAIRNMSDCAGFVPIAFRTNEDWLNLRLTISEALQDFFQLNFGQVQFITYSVADLAYGSSVNPDGCALLKVNAGDCAIGCNDETIDLPEACVRTVPMDVKEFTDFHIEIISEESPSEPYTTDNTEFIVYNIETGEKLIIIDSVDSGVSVKRSFRLIKSTTIGIKAVSRNMLVYRLIDEQGNIIQNKTIYNDSYFEPFKIELAVPGCTDTTAANYDSNAGIDDGSCLDGALYDCVKSALFDIDILKCDTRENKRSLQIYTIYQSYKEAVKENNEIKIEMYGDKLKELCNCETC